MRNFQIDIDHFSGILHHLDIKAELIRTQMEQSSKEDLVELWDQLDISAIYYDCALEGHSVTPDELKTAFDPRTVTNATSLPLYMILRNQKTACDYIRQCAVLDKLVFDFKLIETFHKFFLSKPDVTSKYELRGNTPLHRSYFHEIIEAGKIEANMSQLIASMNESVDFEKVHPIIWAARFHYQFMHIFPYIETSGKIGRAIMNLILVRQGYLPAVIHATERQRYYEVLKQSPQGLTELIVDSVNASLDAAMRFLRRSTVASG